MLDFHSIVIALFNIEETQAAAFAMQGIDLQKG
jgi:hypothetical protein